MNAFKYFVRSVYGEFKMYPGNETAWAFADLLRVKTFNAGQIAKIQALGFTVEQCPDPVAAKMPDLYGARAAR